MSCKSFEVVSKNGVWHELAQIGEGEKPLPQMIYPRVPEHSAQQLRITGFNAKVLIREIEVYSKSTPAWMDIRADEEHSWSIDGRFGVAGIPTEVQVPDAVEESPGRPLPRPDLFGDFTKPQFLDEEVQFAAFRAPNAEPSAREWRPELTMRSKPMTEQYWNRRPPYRFPRNRLCLAMAIARCLVKSPYAAGVKCDFVRAPINERKSRAPNVHASLMVCNYSVLLMCSG